MPIKFQDMRTGAVRQAGHAEPQKPSVELRRAKKELAILAAADATVAKRTKRVSIHLRLPQDVYEAWKGSGDGWQTRMIEVIRKAIVR